MRRWLMLAALLALPTLAHADPPSDLEPQALAAWLIEHGCPGCTISAYGFQGLSVDGANLRGASISGELSGTSMRGADLRDAVFGCTPFIVGGNCTNGGVDEAGVLHLEGANLRGADVSGIPNVSVAGAFVEGATFSPAFAPSLLKAHFETVKLAPTYGSGSEALAFSRAEIERLAPFVRHWDGAWGIYGYELGEAPGPGASFDCGKASTKPEHAICGSAELRALDSMMATLYRDARSRLGSSAVKATQKKWLAERNGCEADAACLAQRLRERIAALGRTLAEAGHAPTMSGGSLVPTYGLSRPLPSGLAGTETGRKLQRLLRHDTDTATPTMRDANTLVVEASALGGNGHSCGMEEAVFVRDADGWFHSTDSDDPTRILVSAGWLEIRNAHYWCGARASLDGIWMVRPTD